MTFDDLGASLRAERERRGLRIEDAADHLKISARHLRALEEGDSDALPHPAYARGFLRSYAAYLGMSPDEIHNALNGVASPEAAPLRQPVSPPEAAPRARSAGSGAGAGRGGLLILVLLLVAAGAYAGWRWGMPMLADFEKQRVAQPAPPLSSAQPAPRAHAAKSSTPPGRSAAQPQQAAPARERQEAPRSATAESGSQAGAARPEEGRPDLTRAEQLRAEQARPEQMQAGGARAGAREPEARADAARTDQAAAGQPSAAESAAALAAAGEAATPGQHKVIITATEECWIHSNADKTDTRQFSLRKGDTFALTFARSLELKLGNAGGVRIRYDGENMPPAGQSGQVRTLTFPPQAGQ